MEGNTVIPKGAQKKKEKDNEINPFFFLIQNKDKVLYNNTSGQRIYEKYGSTFFFARAFIPLRTLSCLRDIKR